MIKKTTFLTIVTILIICSQLALAQQNETASELNQFKPDHTIPQEAIKSIESKETSVPIKVFPPSKKEELSIQNYDIEGEKAVKPFKLNEIIVENGHTFTDSRFVPLYKDMIGQTVNFNDLNKIANKISEFYIEQGFLLTHAYVDYKQNFKAGAARIKVINGGIRQVHVLGADQDNNFIKEYQKKIISSKPVTKKLVQRYVKLIDQMPGYEVQLVKILPVPDHMRTSFEEYADLVIVVKKIDKEVKLKVSNDINKHYGDYKANASFSMFSPFKKGEEIKVVYLTSNKTNALKNAGVIYTQPLNTEGTALRTILSYAESNQSAVSSNNLPSQKNNTDYYVDLELSHPFILTNKFSLKGAIGLNYDRDTQYNNVGLYRRNTNFELDVSTTMQYKDAIKGINYLVLAYGRGLPNSSYKIYQTAANAYQVEGNYNKLNLDYYRLQPLVQNLYFTALATGQYSNKPLPSGQKITFGGQSLVRGYKSELLAASKGAGLALELNYFINLNQPYFKRAELYGFYDQAKIMTMDNETALNQTSTKYLASTGYGVKTNIAGNLKAGLEIAYPLKSFKTYQNYAPINVHKNKAQTTVFLEHSVEW
jgi:hemolysin activation/secretion protein